MPYQPGAEPFDPMISQQFKRRRRDAIPAWGGAPGRRQHKREGLKARSINSFETTSASRRHRQRNGYRCGQFCRFRARQLQKIGRRCRRGRRRSQEFQSLDSLVRRDSECLSNERRKSGTRASMCSTRWVGSGCARELGTFAGR
jgi:hypothetical protein